ncbi:MAG: DUF3999 domain-containing protein [Desulfobulbaceae bacterium]|nr:DUF3999 domain-containing protein [Desulfobulbaceae bacterium]
MRYFLILLIVLFAAKPLLAEKISSRDFAAGYYLEVGKKGAVYSLELPEDVYRTVKSSALSDIRVFNGAGEIVPHGLRTVKTDPKTLRDKVAIPFFPLFGTSTVSEQAEFSLQIARDSGGAIVNIMSDAKVDSEGRKITGYLLDLSDLQKAASAASELEFFWDKEIVSSVFTVSIQQSSDLVRWTPLVRKATLADLQFGGQQVERRTVHLPRQAQKYLKLTWQESSQPLRLTEVTSYSRVIKARRKYRWVSLYNGTAQVDDDQVMVDFETGYQLPTSSVQIRFPETNSIARLAIQSRPATDTGWKTRCEQVFHDLSFEGAAIRNEPCDFPPTADPQWRVVVKQDGAGLGAGNKVVTIQLGWQPSELFFVGRGTPPYILAFGSGKLAQLETNPHDGMLLQAINMESSAQVIGFAKVGKRITLGGQLALQIPAKPTPWKKWLLWTVLVLGVGLLAFMTRSLTKEMK